MEVERKMTQLWCTEEVYTSEKEGCDEKGDGTAEKPFKTVLQAMRYSKQEPLPTIYVDSKKENERWEVVSQSQLKKVKKLWVREQHKSSDKEKKEAEDAERRERNLEEAKKLVLQQDSSLPAPILFPKYFPRISSVHHNVVFYCSFLAHYSSAVLIALGCVWQTKIRQMGEHVGKRVKIHGWVHRLRRQGKALMFITLRDGTGYLQAVLTDNLCLTYDALVLNTEATVTLYGKLIPAPSGKVVSSSNSTNVWWQVPGGVELHCDYWELMGNAPPGGIDHMLNEESHVEVQLEQRHLMLRGETVSMVAPPFTCPANWCLWQLSKIMAVKFEVLRAFREHYYSRNYKEVVPPTFVSGQVEGGATLFGLDYFGKTVNLTQSSQLYLETLLPSLGDVYCIEKSYRAEASHTRRHLTEFQHVEAECPFITYQDLLDRIEDLIVDVVDRVLKSPVANLVREFNPDFVAPQKPFVRMDYSKAIELLKELDIKKDDGTYYEFGEDIPEMPERKMTDHVNKIIMLCRFPAGIKSFYMSKCPEDVRLTESVDVLVPGVGEVVGGSMRIWDLQELMEGYAREGIDPTDYYWYTDQRKMGTCPHGGYGLGLERFVTWLLNRHHIRDVSTFPRFADRFKP
ncbi:NARS [Cordylochernes scorpioides]|uniref:Asparagine--tRNA ligase, cytoplasmic n=1 Tax=Cordylochernes scorpioides TaxID=51811 RepID=A0ABY6L7A9_9ARAC|nr:NARS [Cordylochernes scorpioides]